MTTRVAASCLCERIRLELELPPRFVAHCHCVNCRRAHGAGVVTWAGFPNDQIRVVAGADDLQVYRTETDAERCFCRVCGSTLIYRSDRWPGEQHLAVANLDGALGQLPTAHAYADRAPDWCPITDSLPRFGGESGTEPLGLS